MSNFFGSGFVKIAFYCPLKPIAHPTPSGDREIARGLYQFFQSKGADVQVLSEFRSRLFYRSPFKIFLWIFSLIRAYFWVRREKPDVFFTYHTYYKAPDPIGFLLAWWFRKPYFIFEGMYARLAARRLGYWFGYFLNRSALRYATKIFCDKSEDFLFLQEWFPSEKLQYLPPSVDVELFTMAKKERSVTRERLGLDGVVIVTIAMLRADRKTEGVKFLLRCLGRLRAEGLRFQWLHVGGGVCRQEVQKLCVQMLGKHGRLLGTQEAKDVRKILAAADVFAFPGLDEGFGLVYVEAQAAGLPVVAFKNGGIPDAVKEGVTAFLTPVLEEETYCSALRALVEEKRLREEMGHAAEIFVREKFQRQKNYETLWQQIRNPEP